MDKKKNPEVYEINEYGKLTTRSREKAEEKQVPWQARCLKTMIILFLITVILVTFLER